MTNAVALPVNRALPSQTFSAAELLARLAVARDGNTNNLDAFMNFDGRIGRYTVPSSGGEPDTFPTNTRVLFNLMDTKHGFSCWKGGTVVDKMEKSVLEPLPDESELEDHGPYDSDPQKREGWARQIIMALRDPATGKQYKLRLASVSARDAFGKLLDRLMAELAMYDLNKQTPLISLGSEQFKAKGQKNYKPRFEIVSWETNPTVETAAAIEAPTETASEDTSSTKKASIPASRK